MGMFFNWPWFRALKQTASQVTVRDPGDRWLSAPQPLRPYAEQDWEFAWLAASAYGKTPAARQGRKATTDAEEHVDPEAALKAAGWVQWEKFPDEALQAQIDASHLRVEVWERARESESPLVAVAFGGTVFNNEMDWRANLRWFLPGRSGDQYSEVVHTLAPAFIDRFIERGPSAAVELVSVGHSLGGGLAQQFAYAHCLNLRVPRVTTVYAFDPSPVTGYFSVTRRVREINRQTLKIDRIYERGEILAIVRSITSVLWKPSAHAPVIRGIRYFLFFAWNPIAGHSMVRMAVRMAAAAGHPSRSPQLP